VTTCVRRPSSARHSGQLARCAPTFVAVLSQRQQRQEIGINVWHLTLQPGPEPLKAAADVALHGPEREPERGGDLLVREIAVEGEHHDPALWLSQADDLVGKDDPVDDLVGLAGTVRGARLPGNHASSCRAYPARLPVAYAKRVDHLVPGDGQQPRGQPAPAGIVGVPLTPGGHEDLLRHILGVAGRPRERGAIVYTIGA
jgi:hypothetical protein